MCTVLKSGVSYRDVVIWVVVVVIPFLLGPLLSLVLEFLWCFITCGVTTRTQQQQQQHMVLLLSALVTISYSIRLLITEEYLQPLYSLDSLSSLLMKYLCGSLHLVLVPLIICILDIDIRHGVICLYKRKRTRSYTGTFT